MNGVLLSQNGKITRADLAAIPTPPATATHRPISHAAIVAALIETLAFRHIAVARDEYAVSADGMKMFGVLDLEAGMPGVRFSIGIRNANDKTMRLAMTVGYRVMVCDNMAFVGDFMPVLHKHSKNLDLVELVSIGVDKIQRNFDPLKRQIEDWQTRTLPDDRAKLILYAAFVEGQLAAPRLLLPAVHKNYFHPEHEAFQPRTLWSLSNAFTSAFKELKPTRQFQATAKLGAFLTCVNGTYSSG
jgi:hypothetical protein